MKEEAIETIRAIGKNILNLADLLAGDESPDEEEEVPALPVPEEEPKKAEPVIKLEDVRAVLADISRKGKTAEMKALLSKFGASRLSDVKAEDYAALIAAAKEEADA